MPASSSAKFIERLLDIVFGEKSHALAEKPPRWIRRTISGLYLVCFLLFALWGIGKLGWLPVAREAFTIWGLIAINGFGVGVQWISYGVDGHYRRKARRAVRAAAPQ